ncbi:MAG: 4Fe-4S binding protein [Anaerolineales bacterium]|jgi:formate hydrogenlyase subunit 6/NADH:ubiquinone oxidoreductase subunit I|uniref:4Fe-4S dicluster domain-containing protein n=1 Tax=Candidatus Villigracilis affinis TaxID=3140682 RepID=UPI001B3EB9C1|nr:4Fe-4S binding protein [Anaerolineales bacterium]MBK9601152.1 4Fe-4S binding protein [Anaerolineales bacterium]MBL0347643.1 4Fe-4S binding protein [Anaerolineales bacterium]MBP8047824.1 4Fe-4S binding protein [Anaerolineales bacterium]
MKIGTMLKDIVASFFKKTSTQLYPFEKTRAPERYRGNLFYDPSACTGCCLCVKDCPSKAIELVTLDRAAKRFVLKYHMDQCIYCGQCAVNCKFKCMGMTSQDWEHAALNKKEFTVYYGKDEDIKQLLENVSKPAAEPVDKPIG